MDKIKWLESMKKQAQYDCEQAMKYDRRFIEEKIDKVKTITEIIEMVQKASENDKL